MLEVVEMEEMSSTLRDAFAHHGDPAHRESVIVTVDPACSLDDVEGLYIVGTARSGTIVLGTATAAAVRALVSHEGVVRVEHDGGEMRALD